MCNFKNVTKLPVLHIDLKTSNSTGGPKKRRDGARKLKDSHRPLHLLLGPLALFWNSSPERVFWLPVWFPPRAPHANALLPSRSSPSLTSPHPTPPHLGTGLTRGTPAGVKRSPRELGRHSFPRLCPRTDEKKNPRKLFIFYTFRLRLFTFLDMKMWIVLLVAAFAAEASAQACKSFVRVWAVLNSYVCILGCLAFVCSFACLVVVLNESSR